MADDYRDYVAEEPKGQRGSEDFPEEEDYSEEEFEGHWDAPGEEIIRRTEKIIIGAVLGSIALLVIVVVVLVVWWDPISGLIGDLMTWIIKDMIPGIIRDVLAQIPLFR